MAESEWLDRLKESVTSKEGAELLREVRPWLQRLERERATRKALAAIRAEYQRDLDAYRQHDAATVRRLVEIRQELVALAPDADDSDHPVPEPTDIGARSAYVRSLANFDAISRQTEPRRGTLQPLREGEDPARSSQLIHLLRERFDQLQFFGDQEGPVFERSETNLRPELNELRDRFGAIASEHEREHRRFIDVMKTSPGASLRRLEWLLEEITPEPRQPTTSDKERDERAEETLRRFMWGVGPALEKALYGSDALGEQEQAFLDHAAATARRDVERVHAEISHRVTRPPLPSRRRVIIAAAAGVVILVGALLLDQAIGTNAGRVVLVFVSGLILFAVAVPLLGDRGMKSVLAVLTGAAAFSAVVLVVLSATGEHESDTDKEPREERNVQLPPGVAACPSNERRGRYELPVQAGVREERGAAVREAPSLNANVLKRYPPGCKLQFDGYCLGEAAPDVAGNTPDIIWNRRATERGYMASATLDGFAPPELPPEPCPRGQPGPRRVALQLRRGGARRIGLTADAPAAPLVGFAKFSRGRWETIALDTNGADGWGATFRPGNRDAVVGAFACWAVAARAHPGGPSSAIGDIRAIRRGAGARAALGEARASRVAGGDAACAASGLPKSP